MSVRDLRAVQADPFKSARCQLASDDFATTSGRCGAPYWEAAAYSDQCTAVTAAKADLTSRKMRESKACRTDRLAERSRYDQRILCSP